MPRTTKTQDSSPEKEKDEVKAEENKQSESQELMSLMKQVVNNLNDLDKRLNKIEGGGKNDFKMEAKQEDIAEADAKKADVDPRIVKIVEEVLGVDFGIELDPNKDRPGFLFTILVPKRLSDVPMSTRPVKRPDGAYDTHPDGSTRMEEYWPQDRRSRAVSSVQSFDAIREHCERVRAYIVAFYQKTSRPLPEFKLKINV